MAAPVIEDIQKELDALDKRITGLNFAYSQYFLGMEKFEPMRERDSVKSLIVTLDSKFIRNTGAKFRRETLKAKFVSLARYWDRILKQIEEGTYKGHQVKAALHERERMAKLRNGENGAPADAVPATPPIATPSMNTPSGGTRSADPVQRIFDQFVAAKKKAGESADGLSRDKMAAIISQQTAALKQKYNCKSVEFRVVVEDGKAKLKAVPKV